MARRALLWSLGFLIVFLSSPAAQAETLSGQVEITTPIRKRAKARKTNSLRRQNTGRRYAKNSQALAKKRDEVQSVVVWVLNAPLRKRKISASMSQKNKTFHPFVLPVPVGTVVEFPNNDKIYHGVYSESSARPFELPQYADGESRSLRFDKAGVVEIFCHIHAHMNAYILVLENSYFAQPDAEHRYTIAELPPGRYRVKAWHPKLGSRVQNVEIKKGAGSRLDFKL